MRLPGRANDLGMISASHYRALMAQMSRHGYRLNEPVALEPEEPSIIQSVIDVHIRDHGYSLQEVNRLALVNESDFCRYYPQRPAENQITRAHLRSVK